MDGFTGRGRTRRVLALMVVVAMVVALMPAGALAAREGETSISASDTDGDGKNDTYRVDWDGDGTDDEEWSDPDEDGTIDSTRVLNAGGDDSRSPRGRPGMRVRHVGFENGGGAWFIDWDGDGSYDESWWDYDGDGDVDDTDVYETESKVVDNTKATRFRGVFVGVKNGLTYPEDDVDALTEKLGEYESSWDSSDMTKLKGASATPNAIKNAIDAAKADSKPGDEFLFYFSGHGGGYDKDDGYAGGRLDTDGDETAIPIPESEVGTFDGSDLATPAAGFIRYYEKDLDGDGTADTRTVKNEHGDVQVWRPNASPPPAWRVAGIDTDGDGDVDGDDGGVDMNGDGDKDDTVAFDDVLLVAGKQKVSDDDLTSWLSGFPESVTIVVIIDACYSGSFIPDLRDNVRDADGKPLRPGHLEVIAAAPADEPAWEMPVSHGVLTKGILDGLTRMDDLITGGHDTSLADFLGDEDDRTTTRELFGWAGPSAVTYLNLDNDSDGLHNEDGPEHETDMGDATEVEALLALQSEPGPADEPGIEHDNSDDDGDIDVDEDPPTPPDSFFDVYYDPDFGGEPTPTFKACFAGDIEVNACGLLPGIGVRTEAPFAPGTAADPGPTYEMVVREVPRAFQPDPPAGYEYAGEVYDLSLYEVAQSVLMGEVTSMTPVESERIPIEGPLPAPLELEMATQWGEGGPLEIFWYDEAGGEWLPIPTAPLPVGPDWPADHVTGVVEHCSMFALCTPGAGRPADTTAPGAPWRLSAVSSGGDVHFAWSNPTDPDFAETKLYRSKDGFADGPGDTAGMTLVSHDEIPFEVDDVESGFYYYTAFARDGAGNWSDPAHVSIRHGDPTDERVWGADRYATAVQASKAAFPAAGSLPKDPEGHRSVVVATGENWPDALGGSSLAGAVGGPILLVGGDVLPGAVASEIERLGAERVFLLGGTGAVSDAVASALGAIPGVDEVERVAGADRYETAEKVAARTVGLLDDYDGTALVATGDMFPDALAGSPLATAEGWPIYLASTGGLRVSTLSAMDSAGVTDAIILGGTGVVPASVETGLDRELPGGVERLWGADRYATAAEVAEYGVDTVGMHWDGVALATGADFPDALAGGVMQGLDRSVVMLTRTDLLPAATSSALEANASSIVTLRILGGTGAVTDAVRQEAMSAIE